MKEYRPCAGGIPTTIDMRYQEALQSAGLRYGIVEVTTRCQCACPGCYMVRRDSLNKGDMSLEQAVCVLDLCRDYCGAELETMDLLGGEPLLWPCLQEFIEELLRREILPWIFTNMLAITPELAQWLYDRNVHITGKLNINPSDPLQYPLQGKMLGRGTRVVNRLLAAIKIFQNVGYRDPLFRLQNLIRRQNLAYVPDYYRWCLEQGIGTDLELMGSGEPIGPDYWQVAPTPQQLAVMIRKIQSVRIEFGLDEAEVLMPHVFGSCPFYDKGLYFAVDGHIRACSNSTVELARITDPDPIRKAYESPLICNRLVLSQETVGEPCASCSRWNQCRGGCRATVEGTGDPFGGYPLCPVPFLD
ncbi:4Fe-4S cluster-binding domain-containing protein [Patescibacteria group bacterium]|nr:4Fe-4S cluster-binding domain-containing protein [Patescibacteria group bacterium]MBU1951578.1 4Fe-4S cluster-binding domain-containing protein [Patescibacteria group bacterium]